MGMGSTYGKLAIFPPFPAVDHQHVPIEWGQIHRSTYKCANYNALGPQNPGFLSGFLPGVTQTGPTRIPSPPTTDSLGNQPPPSGHLVGGKEGRVDSPALPFLGNALHRVV